MLSGYLFCVPSIFAQAKLYAPKIDSISVDTLMNGEYRVVMGWEPYDWSGYNRDSSWFIVRQIDPIGGYSDPDTVYDPDATFYIDYSSNPLEEIQGFGLEAITYVNGEKILSLIADQHSRNILPEIISYDSCDTKVSLTWNTYFTGDTTASDPPYAVFAYSDNDRRKVIVNTNSHEFSGLNENEIYEFRIRVIGADYTSTSIPVTYFTNKPADPQIPVFRALETNAGFENLIDIQVDDILTSHLIIFKSSDLDFGFDTLDEITQIQADIQMFDNAGSTDVVYYYLESYDLCMEDIIYSDTINSSILTATDRTSYIEVKGNEYFFGEADYLLQRLADGQENIFEISPPLTYNDFGILEQPLTNPRVVYRLKSITNDSVEIISNPAIVAVKDQLRWPNAIVAGDHGIDGLFRPFIERSVPEKFNMKIFNKWGQLLFESHSIENGWDGTYNGNFVLPGGYLYVATYRFAGSDEKIKKGTVSVIH
jgi:gliding motility-associated-like protein